MNEKYSAVCDKRKKILNTYRLLPSFIYNGKGSMSDEIFGIKLVATDRSEGHLPLRSSLQGCVLSGISAKLYLITI